MSEVYSAQYHRKDTENKSSSNPTDLSLLARYTDIMQKYSDFAVKVLKVLDSGSK